jgi:WD40 repeat protein
MDIHNRNREIVFGEDGAQAFSYGDTLLRSWDLATKRLATDLTGLGSVLAIVPVGPPPDAYVDPPAEGFVLRFYEVSTRRVLYELPGITENPAESAISDEGTMVAAAPDDEACPILVWNVRTGQVTARLAGPSKPYAVLRPKFSRDGRQLASASSDKIVQLWSLTSPGKSG